MLPIIQKRKYAYIFSSFLIFLSLFSLAKWGLKTGIDFRGGTLMEVRFEKTEEKIQPTEEEKTKEEVEKSFFVPTREAIEEKLKELNLKSLTVQMSGEKSVILRYIASDEQTNEKVLEKLKEFGNEVFLVRVDFIGASVSNQLKNNSFKAVFLSVIAIVLYITWAFRQISYPLPSWQYGISAIIALIHDIIITIGFFALLGAFWQVEVDISFIAALLTILGYSINDTIVVYDRIRENILHSREKENFETVANHSINETLARSINTSLTVIVVLLAIILYGGESIHYFAVALAIGVFFGTYSSIFIASALLVSIYNYKLKKK